MSVNIYDKDTQTLTEVAGTGTVEFGASTVRTGTVTVTLSATVGERKDTAVVFDTAMPDSNYLLDVSYHTEVATVSVMSKSTTGFTLRSVPLSSGAVSAEMTVNYTAFKLHTVEGLEELEAAVNSLQTLGTEVTHSWQGTVSALGTTYSTNYTLPTGGKWLVIAEYELNYSTHNASGLYNLTLTDARNVSGYGAPNGNLGKNMHVYSGGTVVTAGAAFYANDEYLNYPLTIWIKGYKIGV